MGKFINPFTDMGFKLIFGQEISKPILIEFLNSLLVGERCIQDVTFLNKEQPRTHDEDRSLIYDVYCKLDNGEHIIVEMQNKDQPYFQEPQRLLCLTGNRGTGQEGSGMGLRVQGHLRDSVPELQEGRHLGGFQMRRDADGHEEAHTLLRQDATHLPPAAAIH